MSNAQPDSLRLHMRGRPGMYIGGLNPRGLLSLLDDTVTDLLNRHGTNPERTVCRLGADGSYTIEFRGGSIDAVEPEAFETDAGEFGVNAPLVSIKILSAFSDPLDAEVVCGGSRWAGTFAAGVPAGPPELSATGALPLLRIHYQPDPALFPVGMRLDYLAVCGRAREWAAFRPHVRLTVEQEEDGQRRDYHYPAGLLSLAQELEHRTWHDPWLRGVPQVWHCELTEGADSAEAVILCRPNGRAVVHSFVNGASTLEEGSHVDGLRSGVAEVAATARGDETTANPFAHPDRRDPLANLTVLLAVRLENPRYQYSTRDVLGDDRARDLVRRMIVEALPGEIERAARGEPPRRPALGR